MRIDDHVHRFGRTRTIGTAHFDIGNLKNNVPVDSWISLSDDHRNGEIRIIGHFTPSNHVHQVEIKKIPNIRIHLEKDSFYPNEIIKGHVIYNDVISTPSKMKEIQLTLRGTSNVHWSVPIVINTGSNSTMVYRNHYRSNHNFFNVVSNLISKSDPKYYCYFFPFQFKLPYSISPSFNHSHGKVSYQCKVKIDESRRIKNKLTCPFQIKDNYEHNIPYRDINETKHSNDIHVDIKHPNIAFHDENHQIIVSIKNESKKPILKASVKLKSLMIFYGKHICHTSKTKSKKLVAIKLRDHSNFPIEQGKFVKKSIALHIPKNTPITIFSQTCPNIQIMNHIVIKTVSKGRFFFKKRKSKFSFPIIIGHRTENYPDISSDQHDTVIHTSEIVHPYEYFAPIYPIKGSNNGFVGKAVPNELFQSNKIIPEQFEGKIREVNYDKSKPIIDKSYKKKFRKYEA